MKQPLVTKILLGFLLSIMITLPSCGDDDNGSDEVVRMEVAWLGPQSVDPEITEALDKYFIMVDASQADTPSLPLLMMGEHAATAADDSSDILQSYHDNGLNIVLIDADASDVNSILDTIETSIHRQSPSHESKEHWWGILSHTGAARTHFHSALIGTDESMMGPIFKKALERQILYHAYENLSSFLAGSDEHLEVRPSAGLLKEAAGNSGNPAKLSEKQLEQLLTSDSSDNETNILADLAYEYSNIQYYYAYYDGSRMHTCNGLTNSECAEKAENYPYAKYTINSYGYSAHSYESGDDYWLFLLNLNMAQANAMTDNESNHRAWFSGFYKVFNVLVYDTSGSEDSSLCSKIWHYASSDSTDIETCANEQCSDSPNDNGLVPMVTEPGISYVESSPSTTSDCVTDTVETSTTSTISGSTGFTGSDGTASMTDSVSNETSNTFSTQAVCIINDSDADIWEQVIVEFDIKKPKVQKYSTSEGGCYKEIDEPSGNATDTFEPWVAWVWKTTDDVRKAAEDAATGDTVALQLCGILEFEWEDYHIHGSCNPWIGYSTFDWAWWWKKLHYNLMVVFPPNDQM